MINCVCRHEINKSRNISDLIHVTSVTATLFPSLSDFDDDLLTLAQFEMASRNGLFKNCTIALYKNAKKEVPSLRRYCIEDFI